jgi:hypothetical protein
MFSVVIVLLNLIFAMLSFPYYKILNPNISLRFTEQESNPNKCKILA